MSYIRGALPYLIYNAKVRDDLVPDGIKYEFELSQEVPGGYEGNVQVIRRELVIDSLVQSCPSISFNNLTSKITCTAPVIAAALSVAQIGDLLSVSGAANGNNNGEMYVTAVEYDGQTISLTVDASLTTEAAGSLVTIERRFFKPWEILNPEEDYAIGGTGDKQYRMITFTRLPRVVDAIYVLHRGEATYNFVPTEKSVGPDQLSDNLRNFKVDVFIGNGTQTDFTLSQFAVNARTLEVSINGAMKYGTDPDLGFTGDFQLLTSGTVIKFATAPANGAKVYVRHLGFSTISRRQTLSPGQIGTLPDNSIETRHIKLFAVTESRIAENAVTTSKILDGAVTGAKILLNNNEWLRWKSATSPNGPLSVLKLNAQDNVELRTPSTNISLQVGSARSFNITSTAISDAATSGQVSIGTSANKFSDGHFSGSLNSATGNFTGDVSVGGNISVGGTVDTVDILALKAQVDALQANLGDAIPAGFISMWGKDDRDANGNLIAPSGYLACDGRPYSQDDYPRLFNVIARTFGGDVAARTFNVPDFRGRFPLGKASGTGTGSGWGTGITARDGTLDHDHTTPAHTHGLANHVHTIPAHFHSMSTLNGSTLKIKSSGTHTTEIDIGHDHTASSEYASSGVSLVSAMTNIAVGTLVNNVYDSKTAGGQASLTITANPHNHIFDQGGEHTHTIRGVGISTGDYTKLPIEDWTKAFQNGLLGNSSNKFVKAQSLDESYNVPSKFTVGNTNGTTIGGSNQGDHTHTLKDATVTLNLTQTDHSHKVTLNDPKHTHTVTEPTVTIGGQLKTGHTHTISVSSVVVGSDAAKRKNTDGSHLHLASDFEGAIGKVSGGKNGDDSFTTEPASSASKTDSGGATENNVALLTGKSNPPFQTINFIIKT